MRPTHKDTAELLATTSITMSGSLPPGTVVQIDDEPEPWRIVGG